MDPNALFHHLRSTLSPSGEERANAEAHLKEFSNQPGFPVALLQLVANAEVDASVRQAGSIYFKNHVQRHWAPHGEDEEGDPVPAPRDGVVLPQISEADKQVVRDNIVETVIHSPEKTRAQVLNALGKIIYADYPSKYPGLLEKLVTYLKSNDQGAMYGALLCLYELVKKYEYRQPNGRAPLIEAISSTFPRIHQLYGFCVQMESIEAALILRIIAKIYYSCIQFALPKELRAQSNLAPWIQVFLQMVDKPLPAVPDSFDPKHKYPWWQAKKWAYLNLNRLFSRYGNPNMSDSEYKKFAKEFLNTYSPQILQSYLKQLQDGRNSYTSPRVLQLNLTFLSDAINHSITWKILKPITLDLIRSIIFPLLCFSDEDQEMWESDPYEYVRNKFDVYEDFRSPVSAGMGFVQQLVTSRKKFTLIPVLSFCNEVLLNYHVTPPQQRNYKAKDGALCMIGSIANVLEKDESFAPQLEGLLVAHVFSEADSPAPFLRARACWIIYNFCDIPFSNPQNVLNCLQVIVKGMKDPELPVKIQGALALGVMIGKEEVQSQIKPMLLEIMQELLNLTNESDIDDLSTVMESMIETFGEEMAPFAVSLSTQLRQTFMRIMEEAESEDDDNKSITAMGVLRTIVTFIRTMEDSSQILAQLEEVFYDLIKIILDQSLLDFLEEALEMIVTFTYSSEQISQRMWSLFPSVYQCFKKNGVDFFSEMLPCFDNYVSRGPTVFMSNPDYMNMTLDIVSSIFAEKDSGEIEKSNGCKMVEVLLLNLPGQIDQYVPGFIELGMKGYGEAETTVLKVCALEVIINALYYNPQLTIHVLESKGWTSSFFTSWFGSVDKFTRVHDLKLCILTLLKLFQVPFANLPQVIQAGYPHAMAVFMNLFERLPAAYETRKQLEELEEDDDDDDDEEGGEIEDEDIDDADGVGSDEDLYDEEDQVYLNTLRERSKEGDTEYDFLDDDLELEEDLMASTPLDDINEYLIFQQVFSEIQQSNPDTFRALTQALNPAQGQFLDGLNKLADQKRIEAAQNQGA